MLPPPPERSKAVALAAYAFRMPATLFCAFTTTCFVHLIVSNFVRSKAVPLQAWNGPEGSRKLRLPDFVTAAQDGGR